MVLTKQLFDEHFDVFIADTAESKKINFKIRYIVFCEDMDNSELFPDEMEWDDADVYAVHFIVRNRYTGNWVAAMRLNNYADFSLAENSNSEAELSKEKIIVDGVKLSRCCVIKDGRQVNMPSLTKRPSCENSLNSASNNIIQLKDFKLDSISIILGLYRAAAIFLSQNKLSYVYLFLTQGMVSYAKQQGIEMNLVGTLSERRGERSLYKFNVNDLLDKISNGGESMQGLHLYSDLLCQSNLQRKAGI